MSFGVRSGITLLEVMVVTLVIAVAVSIFAELIIATTRMRAINRETSIAADSARRIIEQMMAEEFDQVLVLYDPDPTNDPEGEGTAPGNRIEVLGLDPIDEQAISVYAQVEFPLLSIGGAGSGGSGLGPQLEAPPPREATWELREDIVDASLGMPRDLNADSVIDDLDHYDDYFVLPVRIRLEWNGRGGEREFELISMLVNYQSAP